MIGNIVTFKIALSIVCLFEAGMLLYAIYRREKGWDQISRKHNFTEEEGRRVEDTSWHVRYAARWVGVATLLVTGFHHIHAALTWPYWVTSDGDYILPDLLLVVFAALYVFSVYDLRWWRSRFNRSKAK